MIKVENIEVWGFEHAVRGMRNPLNSWDRSDSYPAVDCGKCGRIEREGICHPKEHDCTPYYCYEIGENDLTLMRKLFAENTVYFGKTIERLNNARNKFLETKDKEYWWQMIQLLPSSYNQRRTVTMTYENVMNMLDYREGHKLDEWREFCEILRALPPMWR